MERPQVQLKAAVGTLLRGIICSLLVLQGQAALSDYGTSFQTATATWYGDPNGSGSDGGACGYGPLLNSLYGAKITAGSPALFRDGQGCGTCWQVKCASSFSRYCSQQPVNVTLTDLCPGGDFCGNGKTHFDLSGTAFGALAVPGQEYALRNVGVLQLMYKRVPCVWKSNIQLKVNSGASVWWLSVLVKYVGGAGDIKIVEMLQAGVWRQLTRNWGANYVLNPSNGQPLSGPFLVRVTAVLTGNRVTCTMAIPSNFSPGQTYDCGAQLLP